MNRLVQVVLTSAAISACGMTASCAPAHSVSSIHPGPSTNHNANPIIMENLKPGDPNWRVPTTGDITGYSETSSVNSGDTIRFAVSTTGTAFNLAVYRLGWYGGDGGRLLFSVKSVTAKDQGNWMPNSFGVARCPTCQVDVLTGMIAADWTWSYSLQVPRSWISGVYVARLETTEGGKGSIPFIVRDDSRQTGILAVLPVNTWQAYNGWGGKSIYSSGSFGALTISGERRAVKVSFDRPYSLALPSELDTSLISFLERVGYDVSYATDVDVDRDPQLILNHRVYVAVAHDEYWTEGMRGNVETARDRGVSLAFIGGNDVFWQARYEPDIEGIPRRTLVAYKYASIDPLTFTAPQKVTVRWESPPVSYPQNALTGTGGVIDYPPVAEPWIVAPNAPIWMLAGTGLHPGDIIQGLVSMECDAALANRVSPPGLLVVGSSRFRAKGGQDVRCDSTWYPTGHNSEVFSAGDMGWSNLLAGADADWRVIRLTRNVLDRFVSIWTN